MEKKKELKRQRDRTRQTRMQLNPRGFWKYARRVSNSINIWNEYLEMIAILSSLHAANWQRGKLRITSRITFCHKELNLFPRTHASCVERSHLPAVLADSSFLMTMLFKLEEFTSRAKALASVSCINCGFYVVFAIYDIQLQDKFKKYVCDWKKTMKLIFQDFRQRSSEMTKFLVGTFRKKKIFRKFQPLTQQNYAKFPEKLKNDKIVQFFSFFCPAVSCNSLPKHKI